MGRFGHHLHPDDLDTDEENDGTIDPELRLRAVRTAASTIAESIREEQRLQKRKSRVRKRSLKIFRSKSKEKRKADAEIGSGGGNPVEDGKPPVVQPMGQRRNIYVNAPLAPSERDAQGEPLAQFVRNKVRTTSAYTNFLCK